MYNEPKKFYKSLTMTVVSFFLCGYIRCMLAEVKSISNSLKPEFQEATQVFKQLIANSNWKAAAKISLAVIAVFLIIEAYPVSIPGVSSVPNLIAIEAVFLFSCTLTLMPTPPPQETTFKVVKNPSTPATPPPKTVIDGVEEPEAVERPLSNAFCSANLMTLGHIPCGPVLLPPSKLVEDHNLPPLGMDMFWNEESFCIPSTPASARAMLEIRPFPPDFRKDVQIIKAFVRNPGPSGRAKRNHPNDMWDREKQFTKLKHSILRVFRYGTVQQQADVKRLFTGLIALRYGITKNTLERNARLIGKKALNVKYSQIEKDFVPGQVIGILRKGKPAPPILCLVFTPRGKGNSLYLWAGSTQPTRKTVH